MDSVSTGCNDFALTLIYIRGGQHFSGGPHRFGYAKRHNRTYFSKLEHFWGYILYCCHLYCCYIDYQVALILIDCNLAKNKVVRYINWIGLLLASILPLLIPFPVSWTLFISMFLLFLDLALSCLLACSRDRISAIRLSNFLCSQV